MVARFQTGLRVLLATAMVLSAILPEPIRHTHVGGECPHSHDADGHVHFLHAELASDVDGHRPTQADACHSHGHDHVACAGWSNLLSSAINHQHYFWFGWNFTLPRPNESDHGNDQVTGYWVGIAAGDSLPLTWPQVRQIEQMVLDSEWTRSATTIDVGNQVQRAPEPSRSNFLCDTARHERSGVQLI